MTSEEPKAQTPEARTDPLDYRKELFDLLDQMSTLGLQVSLLANNTKAKVKEMESKQGLVP